MKHKYLVEDGVVFVTVTKQDGVKFIVKFDETMLPDLVAGTSIWIGKNGYAYRSTWMGDKSVHEALHATIAGNTKGSGKHTDHIDGDKLNNTKENLRIISSSGNGQNRKSADSDSKTGIRGVSWHKKAQKWVVQIEVSSKHYYLGLFDDILEAYEYAKAGRRVLMPYSPEAEAEETSVVIDDIFRARVRSSVTGVKGITLYQGKWRARFSHKGKSYHVGTFNIKEEAALELAIARDMVKKSLPYEAKSPAPRTSSGVKGIYPKGNKWEVTFWEGQEQHYGGTFPTIEAAQVALDEAMNAVANGQAVIVNTPSSAASGVEGIYAERGRWRVTVKVEGKRVNVGTFDSIEEAETHKFKARESYDKGVPYKAPAKSASGVRGVYFNGGKFEVYFQANKKRINVGSYYTIEEATEAINAARLEYAETHGNEDKGSAKQPIPS